MLLLQHAWWLASTAGKDTTKQRARVEACCCCRGDYEHLLAAHRQLTDTALRLRCPWLTLLAGQGHHKAVVPTPETTRGAVVGEEEEKSTFWLFAEARPC